MFYLILGMFMDVLSMQVATIPITYPIVTALGVDPIWFGIFIVLMCELGLITPPVGMNLFVVHGIRPDKGGIDDAIVGRAALRGDHDPLHAAADGRAGPRDLAAGQDVTNPAITTPCGSCGASELQRRFRDGSLTPLAVVQACLERLDAVNPRLNAVVARRDDAVLRRGRGQRRSATRAGQPLSALDGIPLTVKDSLLTADLPTTWGSAALRRPPPRRTTNWPSARARAGGALIARQDQRARVRPRRLHREPAVRHHRATRGTRR